MNCEEFESVGMDVVESGLSARQFIAGRGFRNGEPSAALEHANSCPRCAALLDSWQAAREQLRSLANLTEAEQAPARVEMRLRQELRSQNQKRRVRRTAFVTAWALSAAALWLGITLWNNHIRAIRADIPAANASQSPSVIVPAIPNATSENAVAGNKSVLAPEKDPASVVAQPVLPQPNASAQVAAQSVPQFTWLPGSLPALTNQSSLVRVRMQRGSLAALGLPVNEERASDWIQVDLLVGEDGQPQAVRLPSNDDDLVATSW